MISPKKKEAIKKYYKKGVIGHGYLGTAIHFGLTRNIVQNIVNPVICKWRNDYMKSRYHRLKKLGICHQCGHPLK